MGLCVAGVALSTASAASPTAPAVARPHTIAVVRSFVGAFAQSNGRLAWLRGPEGCPQAEVFDLRTHRRTRVTSRSGAQCRVVDTFGVLAFDGSRMLWQVTTSWGLSEMSVGVVTAAIGDRRARVVDDMELERNSGLDYEPPLPMAGASGRLLYYERCEVEADECGQFKSEVRGSTAGRWRRFFKASRPMGLALAGRHVAVLEDVLGCCNYLPSWSPDGRRIAWIHDGSLVVANADGSAPAVVAPGTYEGEEVYTRPDWSPDGSHLVFTYRSQSNDQSIGIVHADGSGLGRLGVGRDPDWSPDGARIAFVRNDDVYRVNADGSQETRLTTDALPTGRPTWSPDGSRLLLDRAAGLYLVDALTGASSRLLAPPASSPAWSPDGARIAFSEQAKGGGSVIAVINADGSGPHELTKGSLDYDDDNPVWSSDGRRIAFDRWVEQQNSEVRAVNADGSGDHVVSGNANGSGPAWAPDRAVLAWGDKPDQPTFRTGGLFVADAEGKRRIRIAGQDQARVEIRNARSGALLKSFTAPGTALAVASSAKYVAVLVRNGPRLELHRFRADGTALGSSMVPSVVDSYHFSLGSRAIVYATGGRIFATDAETGKTMVVARPKAPPVGVSVLGRRLVWAENVARNRALIRAVVLPR
jgi:Tol biopolymer transport system component